MRVSSQTPLIACAAAYALLCVAALASSGCAAARACVACHHSGAHRARLRQLAALVGAGRALALTCTLLLATAVNQDGVNGWPRAVLQSAPDLLALTFYTFVAVYFIHVARLVVGNGGSGEIAAAAGGATDDSATDARAGRGGRQQQPLPLTRTRVYAILANSMAYVGYGLLLAVALIFRRADASLWRWHACFLSAVSLGGGLSILFLGANLRRLLFDVPRMANAFRDAMIWRVTVCTAIAGIGLVTRAVYGLVLASSLLGNDGPYPIPNITVTNMTTQAEFDQYVFECNVAESVAVVVLELLPLVLMLIATKRRRARTNRQGHRSDASLGVEELTSPLRGADYFLRSGNANGRHRTRE